MKIALCQMANAGSMGANLEKASGPLRQPPETARI